MYSKKDWLAKQKEKGETFQSYLSSEKRNRIDQVRNTIWIICMDNDITHDHLVKLQKYCEAFFFGVEVKIMESRIDIPSVAKEKKIANRIRKDTNKIQYLAPDILNLINDEFLPDDAYCAIGIINKDLYPRPGWNFIFGCSRLKKRTGIFSFARYDPDFENKEEDSDIDNLVRVQINQKSIELQDLILYRACKTMTHEIGHMFGIKHCIYHECLMNGTNRLEEGDLKPLLLCPICLRKLHYVIGFDIKERYECLGNVLKTQFKHNKYFSSNYKEIESLISFEPSKISESQINNELEIFNNNLISTNSKEFFEIQDSSLFLAHSYTDDIEKKQESGKTANSIRIFENNMSVLGLNKQEKKPKNSNSKVDKVKKYCDCCCKCTIF